MNLIKRVQSKKMNLLKPNWFQSFVFIPLSTHRLQIKKLTLLTFISLSLVACAKHDDSTQKINEIRLEFKLFHPGQLRMSVDSTVVFNNVGGGGSHSVSGNLFSKSKIKVGETFSYKFDSIGIYSFRCLIHSNELQEQVIIRVE